MKMHRNLIILVIMILLIMSGCSDNGNPERPDIELDLGKSDNEPIITPEAMTTASHTATPSIYYDEEGYKYAHKIDNFIIEYEGLVVKMYYMLTEHRFK